MWELHTNRERVRGANFKYFCQLCPVPLTSCQKYLKLAHRAFNPINFSMRVPYCSLTTHCIALQDASTFDPNPKSCKLPLYSENFGKQKLKQIMGFNFYFIAITFSYLKIVIDLGQHFSCM